MLVQTASRFDSSVYLSIGGKRVNAKSIMGMMSLTLKTDDEVEVEAEGPDEEEAVKAIEAYLSGEQ
jgi:catabolite repression HPr-like protein